MEKKEIIQPKKTHLDKLEKFLRTLLKRILSIPCNSPDPVIYILTGLLPVEAQIDYNSLTLFNNICRQRSDSIEKNNCCSTDVNQKSKQYELVSNHKEFTHEI